MTTPDTLQPDQLKARYRRNFRDQLANKPLLAFRKTVKAYRFGLFSGLLRHFHPAPPARFLLLCRARSGSNYLLTLLDSHPRVRHIWEPFGEHTLRQPDRVAQIKELTPLPYLEDRLQRVADERVAGFKILYHQLEPDYPAAWGIPSLDAVKERITTDPALKVIHLKRHNILRSLVSARVAYETRQYIIFDEKRRRTDVQISLTPAACEREFEAVSYAHTHYDEVFAEHPLLTLSYEALTADPHGEGHRLQAFLGLRPRRLRAATVKQTVRPLSEIVTNYAELADHFAGSQWAAFFE